MIVRQGSILCNSLCVFEYVKALTKAINFAKKGVLSLVGAQALTKEIKKRKIYYMQSSFQVYFCRELKSNSKSLDKVLLQPCFICKLGLMNYPLMVWSLWFHQIVVWIPLLKHFGVPCTAPFYMLNLSDFFYGLVCDDIQDFQCGLRLLDPTLCPDISVSLIWLFLSQKLLIRTLLLITSTFIVIFNPFWHITNHHWLASNLYFIWSSKEINNNCKTNWSSPTVFSFLPYSNSKYSVGLNLMEKLVIWI